MLSTQARARLLWDGGYLWSLMCLQAAEAAGLELCPITAQEVAGGGLQGARLLVVPGGRPALKKRALGSQGAKALTEFVKAGGAYLGFCGGAGLALNVDDGLGLVNLGRAQGPFRLPSLSGPMQVVPGSDCGDHPLWLGQESSACFNVWWPGQFDRREVDGVKALALYHQAAEGLYSADLEVSRVVQGTWPELEAEYGLNLDPAALYGQPAAIEAQLGQGRLLLSYLHLDTPGDACGSKALIHLWRDLANLSAQEHPNNPDRYSSPDCRLADRARELWRAGCGLGLWHERGQALPIWKRGARGLELWSLLRMTHAFCRRAGEADVALFEQVQGACAPVWEQGEAVLRSQAQGLEGDKPSAHDRALEQGWFPAPRRVGGPLLRALDVLQAGLLQVASAKAS